jgi:hypothetical protein
MPEPGKDAPGRERLRRRSVQTNPQPPHSFFRKEKNAAENVLGPSGPYAMAVRGPLDVDYNGCIDQSVVSP